MHGMVSICIVNWNGMDYLPGCFHSIHEQNYEGKTEIIVVDNGSTDDSLAWIQEKENIVKLLCNNSNRGFAPAHNQAIKASRGE